MAIGLCCHFLVEEVAPRTGKISYRNIMDERVLQLGRWRSGKYTEDMVKGVYVHNAKSLLQGLQVVAKSGIKSFRVSSGLFPLWDQVPQHLWNNEEVIDSLKKVGAFVREKDIRVTTHPGQFCSLSSDSESVVSKTIQELACHAWVFDCMGLPETQYSAINIHGAKANRSKELISVINDLQPNLKNRLTLENDEMSYSVVDLLEISQATGVPVVVDSHHHSFNTGELSLEEALSAGMATWSKDIKPLQHLSNTHPTLVNGSFPDRRKHSDWVYYIPEEQLDLIKKDIVDVDAEFKLKNLAINRMIKDFSLA
jgi:UV DNA damage endonuclease